MPATPASARGVSQKRLMAAIASSISTGSNFAESVSLYLLSQRFDQRGSSSQAMVAPLATTAETTTSPSR